MYACIDIGSNSFHLLIGEWRNGKIEIIERCSEKVQLGEGVHQTGRISKQAFERGVCCLKTFLQIIRRYPIKAYWALGTNTIRNADNADDFLQRAAEIGINISPISGVQEAVLVYAGVLSSQDLNEDKRLVIDIGGGSTEVIVGQGHRRLFTESLQIGSVSWRDQFFTGVNDETGLLAAMHEAAHQAEASITVSASAIKKLGAEVAFASSGTSKMLAAVCHNAGGEEGVIDYQLLQAIQPELMLAIKNGEEIAGVKERRRDLLLGSWGIMIGLMRAYQVDQIRFSPTALREGMLDFMVKNKKTLAVMVNSDLPAVNIA